MKKGDYNYEKWTPIIDFIGLKDPEKRDWLIKYFQQLENNGVDLGLEKYIFNSEKLTLDKLKKELEPFRNTLVIDGFDTVVRLVDVIDGEDDFYWVYDSKKGIIHASCVSGWIPLKGFIENEKYERMVRIWNLNNIEKAI